MRVLHLGDYLDFVNQVSRSRASTPDLEIVTREEYARRVAKWYEQHAACPQCGGTVMEVTTGGTLLPPTDAYPDLNRATCLTCGWHGQVVELVVSSTPGPSDK